MLVPTMKQELKSRNFLISALLSIDIASISANGVDRSPSPSVDLCVSLPVQKVYCGKTVDWIQMPFGMVSAVSQGMGVLDWVVIIEEEGAVWG